MGKRGWKMPSLNWLRMICAAIGLVLLTACGVPPNSSEPVAQNEIIELTRGIQALGPNVDPAEAARAAQIAFTYSRQLAVDYQITDPPLIHNMKVNSGLRPRGLCWHWAEDLEARLRQENFQTLDLHRAIANADRPLFIEHSTAILSPKGATIAQGMIVDPWRYGGKLYWGQTTQDPRYTWYARETVFEWKRNGKRGSLRALAAG